MGIMLVTIGMGLWFVSLGLRKLPLLTGLVASDDYSVAAASELVDPAAPAVAGQMPYLYRAHFFLSVVGGSQFAELLVWLYRFAVLLSLLQLLAAGVGFFLCLSVPPRFGTRQLAIAALGLTGLNLLVTFFFMFVPSLEIISFMMPQLTVPEVCMITANSERMSPIHVTWAAAPFLEGFLSILFTLTILAEPIVFCIFLRSSARSLKDVEMEKTASGLVRLGLGVCFIQVAYFLLSNSGTSEVVIIGLKFSYYLGLGFYIGFLVKYVRFLFDARRRIYIAITKGTQNL
jgi:hypothetical protein